jgi:hypothetical protein
MDEDGEVTIKLPLRQWRLVASQVEGGIYREVQSILAAIYAQVNSQIVAANELAAAQAVAAEIHAASAAPQLESTAEEHPEPQPNTQRASLH